VQVKEIPSVNTTFVETQYAHIKIKKPDPVPVETKPVSIQNVAATT